MLRTRIAPAPTGDLHLGTARTAYFNYLAAMATGGEMILRIDDTNAEKNIDSAYEVIYDSLDWLGLEYSEYFLQSDRTQLYQDVAKRLYDKGYAVEKDNGAIALMWNSAFMPSSWYDDIAGDIAITDTNRNQIDQKLILTKGGDQLGTPTYQLATVVDDYYMGVNYIIRGTDHTSNTPKQLCLWAAIRDMENDKDSKLPGFAHVGLIMKNKKKMSKRDGAASLLTYKEQGYDPDAILNFLLRLGWGPTEDNKANSIIWPERAASMFFSEGNMRSQNAGFDQAKLDWFDRTYKKMKARAA